MSLNLRSASRRIRTVRAFTLSAHLLASALLAPFATAEDRNDAALWTVSQLAVPIDDRFAVHLMVQNRWVRDIDSYERTVVRPWISFDWTERIELAVGYDGHHFENPLSTLENRAWQRIAYHHDFGGPALFTHFWLEERFFENTDSVAWRGRFQIGGLLDLPHDYQIVVRNEFFVDFNETTRIRHRGLGENHIFAGVRRPIRSWLGMEIGYLMQYLDRRSRDVFNHTLIIGFSFTTPQLMEERRP